MTSFHDIFNFLWNPFTEIVLAIVFFACVFLWLQRSELSKTVMVIPALPWLGAIGSILYLWSTTNWSWSLPINDYGVEPTFSLFNAQAQGETSFGLSGWLKFLIFFIFIGILLNCALFVYTALVRWPIQKAKEELEAAVGRDTGRRSGRRRSTFVGETGMEPSAPVTALLNRRPGSRLGNMIDGRPEVAKGRTQTDADRRAAMQRDLQQSAGGTPSVAAVASPGGAAGPSSADSTRLAQLISSIQSDSASTMSAPVPMGHCTKCGVALTQPDHHICPVPGGDNLFCGKCGAPHEPKGKVCVACGSPLNVS